MNTYITTPIYYVNDSAHIGHAYTTIIADVLARYHRLCGDETIFLTGTDEHGQKIEESAAKQKMPPQEFTNIVSERFKKLWRDLEISHDIFLRTTDRAHCECVQKIFEKMLAKGDIYKGEYEGHYCVSCESFYAPNALIGDENCPDCGKKTRMLKEESYFFALSKYEQRLLDWIEQNPNCIRPEGKKNEVIAFIKQGLKDLSVTRTSFSWGISVPSDPKHVIYVWLDALANYISALGYEADGKNMQFWPASVHLVGKDILKFHAIYWPCFLMSLDLPLPKCVAAHGWWTANGAKMSKSVGNVIAPMDIANAYGIDAMRYFLLSAMPFGNDGDFSASAMVGKINSELCNELGNLLSRTLSLVKKFYDFGVSSSGDFAAEWEQACKMFQAADVAMSEIKPHEYCAQIMSALRFANGLIAKYEPWALAKTDSEKCASLLVLVLNILKTAGLMLAPVLIKAVPKMLQALNVQLNANEFAKRYEFQKHFKVGENFHMFQKIEPPKENEQPAISEPECEKDEKIKIDDFAKIQMKVALVLSCERIDGSEKLLKFMLDVGEKQPRQVLSGIAKYYEPSELVGKQIILLANLAERKIFKHLSQGMILSAKNSDESLVLLSPLAPCENGAQIG